MDVTRDGRAWRQRERDELGLVAALRVDSSRVDRATPLVNEVGIEAMGQRHLSHRRSRFRARGQHLLLELRRMAPTADALGVFHGVHLSPWWTPSSWTQARSSRRDHRALTAIVWVVAYEAS